MVERGTRQNAHVCVIAIAPDALVAGNQSEDRRVPRVETPSRKGTPACFERSWQFCSPAWSWWRRPAAPADAGPAVERAQRRLNQLGCQSGPVDGRPGRVDALGGHPLPVTAPARADRQPQPRDDPQAVRRRRAPLRRTTGTAAQRDRAADRDQPAPELGLAGRLRRARPPPERDDRQPPRARHRAGSGSGPTAGGPPRSAATTTRAAA